MVSSILLALRNTQRTHCVLFCWTAIIKTAQWLMAGGTIPQITNGTTTTVWTATNGVELLRITMSRPSCTNTMIANKLSILSLQFERIHQVALSPWRRKSTLHSFLFSTRFSLLSSGGLLDINEIWIVRLLPLYLVYSLACISQLSVDAHLIRCHCEKENNRNPPVRSSSSSKYALWSPSCWNCLECPQRKRRSRHSFSIANRFGHHHPHGDGTMHTSLAGEDDITHVEWHHSCGYDDITQTSFLGFAKLLSTDSSGTTAVAYCTWIIL